MPRPLILSRGEAEYLVEKLEALSISEEGSLPWDLAAELREIWGMAPNEERDKWYFDGDAWLRKEVAEK
jgi:hypothetical protein